MYSQPGFLYWEFRQSVRGNNSEQLDLLWRECISFMHTQESNKTQYAPMAILRVFWSNALHPFLAQIYHRHRTVSLSGLPGSNVGWDMPIEKENLMISKYLWHPSYDRICAYVDQLNFLGPVQRAMSKILRPHRANPRKMKKIKDDVRAVVDHLKAELGSTWQEAAAYRVQKDSKLVNPAKSPKPWDSVMRAVNSGQFDDWVRGHLDTKVTWM